MESFDDALNKNAEFWQKDFYYADLKRYTELFPRENIKIMLFDDLKEDPAEFLRGVERFLGVREFVPENIHRKSNTTTMPRSKNLNASLHKIRLFIRRKNLNFITDLIRLTKLDRVYNWALYKNTKNFDQKPTMSMEEKKKLYEYFSEDINKLELLLEKDLSHWKN